jgi:putative SOS response-associated peptidase YedK
MNVKALVQTASDPVTRSLRWGYRWNIWKGDIRNTWFWNDDVLLNDFEGRTNSFRLRRCVVQAEAFIAKQRDEEGIARMHLFSPRPGGPIYFAGVYSDLEGLALILHHDSEDPWCNAFGLGMPIFVLPENVGRFLQSETSGEEAFEIMARFRPSSFRVERIDRRKAA